jgi:hypothetical protein
MDPEKSLLMVWSGPNGYNIQHFHTFCSSIPFIWSQRILFCLFLGFGGTGDGTQHSVHAEHEVYQWATTPPWRTLKGGNGVLCLLRPFLFPEVGFPIWDGRGMESLSHSCLSRDVTGSVESGQGKDNMETWALNQHWWHRCWGRAQHSPRSCSLWWVGCSGHLQSGGARRPERWSWAGEVEGLVWAIVLCSDSQAVWGEHRTVSQQGSAQFPAFLQLAYALIGQSHHHVSCGIPNQGEVMCSWPSWVSCSSFFLLTAARVETMWGEEMVSEILQPTCHM